MQTIKASVVSQPNPGPNTLTFKEMCRTIGVYKVYSPNKDPEKTNRRFVVLPQGDTGTAVLSMMVKTGACCILDPSKHSSSIFVDWDFVLCDDAITLRLA